MNQADILKLAEEARVDYFIDSDTVVTNLSAIFRFAELVAQHERDQINKPALTAELKAELIHTIEILIEMNYAPERNCSCHISPPCNDCVEYSYAREVNEHAKSAITKLTNLGEAK